MNPLQRIITNVKIQLYCSAFAISLLGSGWVFFICHWIGLSLGWSALGAVLCFALLAYSTKLFQDKQAQSVALLHEKLPQTEYSLTLLQRSTLNIAEQLQLERLMQQHILQTPFAFSPWLIRLVVAWVVSLLLYGAWTMFAVTSKPAARYSSKPHSAVFVPVTPPQWQAMFVEIQPPAYTGLPAQKTQRLDVTALVGSHLRWTVQFSHPEAVKVNIANQQGTELPFQKKAQGFVYEDELLSNGLYTIKAYWKDSLLYQSDYFRLEALPDLAPKIEPQNKELYQIHHLNDPKSLTVAATISDDFLVSEAFLVATLARGSGENVKFREMKIPLNVHQVKQAKVQKTLDLKAMQFTPGDELYYYWAAFDNRQPQPNFSKSDTYFVVYKDTTQAEEADLATMAMNIMPEYFRSQRQIIIDTEKLIAKRKKLDKHSFNSTSNEIGFDQKALRLRYGQYLGEEFENNIGGGGPPEEMHTDDPLKGFRHDHDEGEHDHEESKSDHHDHHEHEAPKSEEKDPMSAILADFMHSHDDGEANTFYEQSTRSLLKMSLEQMWQSELHLRMYEPEKALPFEKKALEYLKSAQHKARTFVKKTSFDPPPIKEKEKRLTGELTKFNAAFQLQKNLGNESLDTRIATVMGIAEAQQSKPTLTALQKQQILQLGMLLSEKAINQSMKHWRVLSDLQKMVNGKALTDTERKRLERHLYELIAGVYAQKTGHSNAHRSGNEKLEKAFRQKLEGLR